MRNSYRAILKGNQLEWITIAPPDPFRERTVEVTIVHDSSESLSDGKRMAEALEKLAASNAFSEISDPSEWQREIRKDRPLPGRDV